MSGLLLRAWQDLGFQDSVYYLWRPNFKYARTKWLSKNADQVGKDLITIYLDGSDGSKWSWMAKG